MTLASGSRLGPYEIFSLIGAGGMGEVYKAKDTRLDRTVAIKVLPSHLAENPERRERFEREARAVSSLNHPHICTLHDIGEQDGTHYLVMEYIEGETLADRLAEGPLPLDQALRYGIEIADALDKAHRQGVVHRDLKPGNMMLTKMGPKLLDFGLAKLKASESGRDASVPSALPTEQKPLTKEGSILGTFQYMAPEQLEGKEADARTDIFAFGSVLYEMLTGKKAFEGKSQASLIGAILKDDPPLSSELQPMSPPLLDRVVKKCLAKDPQDRWQTACDLTDELQWITDSKDTHDRSEATTSTPQHSWRWTIAISLASATIASLASWNVARSPSAPSQSVMRFTLEMNNYIRERRTNFALSPDGQRIVYVAEKDGIRQLYTRALNQLEPEPIAGTEGASIPFFSPDGEWVGFTADYTLKKVALAGGPSTTLQDVTAIWASWRPSDTILIESFSDGTPLYRISASGGEREIATHLIPEDGETNHCWPEVLPGGRAFLYNVRYGRGVSRIAVQSVETGERKELLDGVSPRYVPTGHIVFAREGGLWAVPFDAQRLELTSEAVPVIENLEGVELTGQFALSDTGTLAFVAAAARPKRVFLWVDRSGHEEPLPIEPDLYNRPRLSPDNRRLAVELESEIWAYELANGRPTRLTFDPGLDLYPLWTPDGQKLAFSSGREGVRNLFMRAADGTGQVERLTTSLNIQSPWAWSRDGNKLIFQERDPETTWDIRILSMEGVRHSETLIGADSDQISAAVSPNGRWIAYESYESEQGGIYVRPFPNVEEGRWQVSQNDGFSPRWSPDGRELFYLTQDAMVAVSVEVGTSFETGTPKALFEWKYFVDGGGRSYDISSDGTRFLVLKEVETGTTSIKLVVVLNWLEELKRLVPVN